jgi:hypothetical protein
MQWNEHSDLRGTHSFLSPSKYYWLNYDDDKLADAYYNSQAASRGTEDHAFAALCIERGQKLPRSKKTLNMYVNDAIDFKMRPEQILFYSGNCYGSADAIMFRKNFLRIHDLKTGVLPAHIEQLRIYAALFCLEYSVKPSSIDCELRIYQSGDILYENPDPEEISFIMNDIVKKDRLLRKIQLKEE